MVDYTQTLKNGKLNMKTCTTQQKKIKDPKFKTRYFGNVEME